MDEDEALAEEHGFLSKREFCIPPDRPTGTGVVWPVALRE